jgi:3D (Asp-Asp-Asp) domain-containing protein
MHYLKNILGVLLLVGLGFTLWQQDHTVDELTAKVAGYEARLQDVELALIKKDDANGLFYRFLMQNHRNMQNLARKRLVTVTAYSNRAAETDSTPNQTATNREVRAGMVAVSRDLFDSGWVFGKKVYIKGLGIYTIQDLTAQEKVNTIDIYIGDTEAARQFGRKSLEAHLIDI